MTPLFPPHTRALSRLAAIGGECERLAASLERHAASAASPHYQSALEGLAAVESADAQTLREVLLAYGVRPTPQPSGAEGANNWARISADLRAEVEVVRALNLAISEWTGLNFKLAEQLRNLAGEKENTIAALRDLASASDPQALD